MVMQTQQFIPSKSDQIILVPIDFSDSSRSALIYASQIVKDVRKQLILLHVVHDDPMNPGLYSSDYDPHMSRPITDIAAEMLTEFISEVSTQSPGLCDLQDADVRLVCGVPGTRIVEMAEHLEPDSIIMGSHGRSTISLLMKSSVANYVTRHARVPTITVNDHQYPPGLEGYVYHDNSETTKETVSA